MTIYNLQQKLQCGFWAMLEDEFQAFNASVEAVIKGDLPYPEEDEVEDEEAQTPKEEGTALVIPVKGTLMKADGLSPALCQMLGIADMDALYEDIKYAGNEPSVEAIIFDINSPGGNVMGTYELGALIASISENKPVIAYSSGLAASAAYWLASQCTEFYCSPSSLIGSVGVSDKRVDLSKALAKQYI
jgi:ClpP class serine protease